MCEAIGHPVLKLVRVRIGEFSLGELPVGQYQKLDTHDLAKLLSPGRSLRKG
jgi:16S rRNA U516 pseudouridylate synthase RsuA-like enzyme